ncbi:hypothetical protein [Dokdonia sp.]|uniref:hypothetical protein n=1 Tax=Dokdonia sp. TaxID=2024995 RepID=UPI00326644F6
MAKTFIDYREDIGFWVAEIYMELTYEYVLQALNSIEDDLSIREELIEDIEFNINGLARGMLTLTWYSFLKNEEQLNEIDLVLNNAKNLLLDKGEYILVEELNKYEVKKKEMASKWPKPIKTSEVIKIVEALILMLNDEWYEPNYSMNIDYSFL